jgi:hypothetical protein
MQAIQRAQARRSFWNDRRGVMNLEALTMLSFVAMAVGAAARAIMDPTSLWNHIRVAIEICLPK